MHSGGTAGLVAAGYNLRDGAAPDEIQNANSASDPAWHGRGSRRRGLV